MERSEGGQRLVDIDEVARACSTSAGRRRRTGRSWRRRRATGSPGIVTRIEKRPRRGRRRGHRRPASAGQPHDRRGRRRARPQGRRRGGLRRQGDQRHRRDPVRRGSRAGEVAPRRSSSRRPRRRLLGGTASRGSASTAVAEPTASAPARRPRRADHLRRRIPQGRPRQGQDRLRDGHPGHDR